MSEPLSRFCAEYRSIDTKTADEVRRHLLDWLGLVAGGREYAASSESVLESVATLVGEVPQSIPDGRRLDPDRAALLAGTFAHSLDFDDTHRASSLHPGAPVIAAALPIARDEEVSAEEFLTAVALGYDVTCALGRAVDPDAHYARGFHLTATCGSFGAAAAVGALLGFDADAFEDAFGVIGSEAAGSLQFLENGAWNKRLHPGLAGSRGVRAAMLAQADFRGAAQPITGEYGFLHGYTDDPHPEHLTDIEPGRAVAETGLKPYPCCRYMHAAIDGLLELAGQVTTERIERITVDLPAPGVRLTGEPIERKRRPGNFVDCQFSMPFATALVLTTGEAGLSAFLDAQDRLDDPALTSLMDRVDVISTDRVNDTFPEQWSAHVAIEAGESHEVLVDHPRGEPEDPMSATALETKFHELVRDSPLAGEADAVVEAALHLGEDESMDRLFAVLND